MSASAFSDLTSKRKGLPLAKGEDHTGARPDGMELRQGARRSVLVVQRRLPHYRVPYFEALRVELNRRGWDLRLAHGVGTAAEQIKNDSGSIAWAESLETRYLFGGRLCWQPFSHLIRDAAMVRQHRIRLYCMPALLPVEDELASVRRPICSINA